MMTDEERPVSALVSQGWEVVSYSTSVEGAEGSRQSVLLRKQKQHKIIRFRPKMLGKGYVVKEMDV
ncbi:hypothetical protein [Asticcacaulis sp. DW145]|uniref:hypothetical protein n=1 Tax=Asticcacaulis sp. DW145 TaxID=3095608 RepID=UPI0030D0C4E8